MNHPLSPEDIDELRERHRGCRERRAADRIKAVLMLNAGYCYGQVAESLLLDDATVRDWDAQFRKDGLDTLLVDRYTGGTSFLTESQEAALATHVDAGLFMRVADLIPWVTDQFEVTYSVDGLTDLLHPLGFVYKEAVKVPPANLEAQIQFLEQYETLKACKKPEDRIYFGDAVHPSHDTKTSGVWVKKGTDKELPASSGRKRVTLNGAYCPDTTRMVLCEEETADAAALVRLLERLEQYQLEGLIFLILDNARQHRSKQVVASPWHTPGERTLHPPPYSPNLNPIKRLWGVLHRNLLPHH